jgi:hypothetical protein
MNDTRRQVLMAVYRSLANVDTWTAIAEFSSYDKQTRRDLVKLAKRTAK